ncbi:MAG: argininosuccinate lyase [Candidatus Lokiarchaeota archaeon]|nr:argininosuccinate lyase [Candidatus Lokiarchaeota archaeon]
MKKDIYRKRITKSLGDGVLNFLSSLIDDLWIVAEDIVGTEVHNIMLYEQKILDREEIKKILLSLEKIKKSLEDNTFKLNHEFEDIHPLIENLVIDDIGIEVGGKIHTGRSRNDQVAVDMRLKIRRELNELTKQLFDLYSIVLSLSEKNIDSYMPLYTHLQKGQLGCFAHYMNTYLAQILRVIDRISEIYKRVNKNPLGACAIGGTSININRKRTTELLGFNGLVVNSIDAISSRDYIYETLSILSLLGLHYSRIAEDLLIWSTEEFGFIDLDESYCSVSSVMPQKKNPDTLELIRSKSSILISNQFKACLIIKAIPSGYFRDFQELKPILKESFDITHSITEILIGIFSTISVKRSKMREKIKNSYILALDLAELLVQEYNIPFRISHQIVADLVNKSENPKVLFRKEIIQEAILENHGQKINVSENLIKELGDVEFCLKKRISKGSPSEKQIREFIEILKSRKKDAYSKYLKRIANVKVSEDLRKDIIKELTS